ncbi:hypothetical protein HG530_004347 [Fusarium avenaceum]|nr:hypothetical protein HG530_004347 [Fusarium avenaceum]
MSGLPGSGSAGVVDETQVKSVPHAPECIAESIHSQSRYTPMYVLVLNGPVLQMEAFLHNSRDSSLALKQGLSSLFVTLISGDAIDSLGEGSGVIRLAVVDNTRASEDNAGMSELSLVQKAELGIGDSLLDVVLAGLAVSDALKHLNGLLGALADRGGGAAELDSKETRSLAASGGGGHVLEELANPLGERIGRGTVGNESDVGLGVSDVGVAGDVLLVQVLLVGSRGAGEEGGTKTSVESDGVCVIKSNCGGIGVKSGLLVVKNTLDILVELVG